MLFRCVDVFCVSEKGLSDDDDDDDIEVVLA